ncbi:hypothetical protein M413DRAFT_194458 [Hebeloma cylindrosporum]|uniref:Uncharacterized protein n=1 Tax=Hebeloma cylindrosporum TaxID=76867 RepID=A0A0C2YF48_HEBCY|nr:hypothetical protein M413DRAFT_194458 [Hebeloma cylindrosporum h7]
MMLVQLPAMDAVPVPALPALPSWPSFLSSSGPLPKPSLCVWLLLLVASLVILSTIRAAFLYIRPPRSTSTGGKLGISIVRVASENERKVSSGLTAATIESVPSPSALVETKTSVSSTVQEKSSKSTITSSPKEAEKKVSSWLFGLVKWETLPALPTFPSLRQTNRNTLSISQTERGGWLTSPPPHQQQHHMRQSSRRFNHPRMSKLSLVVCKSELFYFIAPSPAYSSDAPPGPPVSMAKMIMSRHTFRRPASRPPPVRSANVVQYQRKFVAGGESV